ncbi:MAG: DNA methyltransferase [Nitrospiraceae bacterium]
MPLEPTRTRQHLAACDFRCLFIEELGWDTHTASIEIPIDGQPLTLTAVAQKRGMVAFHCPATGQHGIPDYPTRRKIDRQLTKSAQEHLIIYTDPSNSTQVWQWVKREVGKPTACREHTYHRNQPGDALILKLQGIAFSLEEEEQLSLVEVTTRARAAFDVERVTKRFYDTFQKEHTAFLKFLKGIPDDDLLRWYASVMLNRLMFVYFIQKKGFLDGNRDYLRIKLNESQARGKDRFYRDFLCPLFFEGFAKKDTDRGATVNRLLGKVPYLNGGLFLRHHIEEQHGKDIQVADAAFARLFAFFEQYNWHLDERPLRRDDEINPDVLGYIFEKYINQKQMGAYYTKEDITGYISQNTVIPFLFDAARQKCKIAFEGNQSVWRQLQLDPDRYIYEPVKKGVDLELPPEIASGLKDISNRTEWNKAAPSDYSLPTEIWREVVARRARYLEVRKKLADGEIGDVNHFITYNLDIRQFAQDVIENSEGPELLRAFYHAIEKVTVLDPTCGSGAFLFAALNILEPLYEACLDRMEVFLDELTRSGTRHLPEKFNDFRKILDRVTSHPNRRYFILKSIILNNLYGVDIMEEAVEICKLRLFLKLVAQVEKVEQIEPLPDIDFNIRAGNTLVGYASLENLKKSMEGDWVRLQSLPTIEENAEIADRAFQKFHEMQTEHGMEAKDFAEAKEELRRRLQTLEDELNRYLANEYGVEASKRASYAKWLASHKPFHWFIEFYRIMKSGGFDVIIGNPPYVEMHKVTTYSLIGYVTKDCGNLYPPCVERSSALLRNTGSFSMIVPLSGFSTDRMEPYQDYVWNRYGQLHISYYSGDAHPSVMFNGVKYRLCIVIGGPQYTGSAKVQTTDYLRWYADERPYLFAKIAYSECGFPNGFLRFAKLGSRLAAKVLGKIVSKQLTMNIYFSDSGPGHVTYHRSPVFWIRSMDFEPYFKSAVKERSTDHLKDLYLKREEHAKRLGAILNSTLFYFWFTSQGNCRNIAGPDIENFPIGDLNSPALKHLEPLFNKLMKDLQRHSRRRIYNYEASGQVEYDEFYPDRSKPIIDEIDRVLAKHYGFTDEELDFIINYDGKYRMGQDAGSDDGE